MDSTTAKDVSAYLVSSPECYFGNSFDGNMKLQKLLVFSNLIHYTQHQKFLFDEDMYAFKNGIVVEDIRIPFQNDYFEFTTALENLNPVFDEAQLSSINMSIDIFNKLSAKELSDLHHELQTWNIKFNKSRLGSHYIKDLSLIKHEDIFEDDIEKLKKVISSYNSNRDDRIIFEVINDVTFYYDPSEISLDDNPEFMDYLETVSRSVGNGEDYTFFLSYDVDQGLYYY
ncbi:Panacea domain-containing protein [Exiguobacterium oxidotolerans]|uniref:Panacea domain-containing protein n=1 Tax=Exiguobacterium oxidotolerans TaxID=223958 RepID=UPI00068BC3C1|nr:type II toxin-antitoxin system antitoxin SocA domain-containing protein [Exiguobacterium oxidotolerans]